MLRMHSQLETNRLVVLIMCILDKGFCRKLKERPQATSFLLIARQIRAATKKISLPFSAGLLKLCSGLNSTGQA